MFAGTARDEEADVGMGSGRSDFVTGLKYWKDFGGAWGGAGVESACDVAVGLFWVDLDTCGV